jgi:hypothetical protein
MLEETGTKVSISTVKRVLHRHNLKGRSTWKKQLLQTLYKKPDYGWQLYFWRNVLWSDETKIGLWP